MANLNNRFVNMRVDRNWFNTIFEPERKRMQNKIGISNLSQTKFTAYLGKTKTGFKYSPNLSLFSTRKKGGLGF